MPYVVDVPPSYDGSGDRRYPVVYALHGLFEGSGFWERQWGKSDLARYLARFRNGRLGYFDAPFRRYLPRDAPVLEGGCGRGQHVLALARLGYDVHGVEYAEETVRASDAIDDGDD